MKFPLSKWISGNDPGQRPTPGNTGSPINVNVQPQVNSQISGYSWPFNPAFGVFQIYAYDCLYCGALFMESPITGPHTGAGFMGQSYGLNVVCPRCGSTNTSGPRLAHAGEQVIPYNEDPWTVPGLGLFTGEDLGTIPVYG